MRHFIYFYLYKRLTFLRTRQIGLILISGQILNRLPFLLLYLNRRFQRNSVGSDAYSVYYRRLFLTVFVVIFD